MRNDRYYGRIFKVPPLQQVRRELRAFIAVENVRELCAEAEGLPLDTSWSDLAERRAAVALSLTDDWSSAPPSPQPTGLEDKFENMGAQMVREVASRTNDAAGDGTTAAYR